MTASLTAAWYTPSEARQASDHPAVPGGPQFHHIRDEQHQAQHAAEEDGEDGVGEIRRRAHQGAQEGMLGVDEEEEEIAQGFREDLHRLEDGELDGLVLLPQFGEEDGRDAVAEQDGGHVDDEGTVSFIAQGGGDGV